MKITSFDSQEEWLEARKGKITGSRLKKLIVKRGTEMKKGFWELIAERLVLPADAELPTELPMDRGKRLESEAVALFMEATGKKLNTDLVIWMRDDNERIAISPDGYTEDLLEAVEAKCLNSEDHIKAFVTQEVPSDYEEQVVQYFVVNEKLERLYFVMYDPRMSVHSFFYLVVEREEVEAKAQKYLADQQNMLATIEATVARLTEDLF